MSVTGPSVAATDPQVLASAPEAGETATRIAVLLDPVFLAEIGWDPLTLVLEPAADHPLLGRPVCRAEGCSTTAPASSRICAACQRRLVAHALDEDEVGSLPARPQPTSGPGGCVVTGCARAWTSSRTALCSAHQDQQRALDVTVSEFCARPEIAPLAAHGPCEVAACPQQRRHHDGHYCEAHQQRLRAATSRDPRFDERRWRQTDSAVGRGGQISFRGLPTLVVAELLIGLQQRCRLDAVKTKDGDLRGFCNQLRRQQSASIADHVLTDGVDGTYQATVNAIVTHARRALASPESEVVKDDWDLVLFGHQGTLTFTNLTQRWLREAAKRWAADDLPKRRVRAGRRTSGGLSVRHHLGCLARLSESLSLRADRGELPAALGRADMEAFLNRLAYQHSTGQISLDARIRACREVRGVLARVRAMGLTRPGGIAAGLGEDFTIDVSDIPATPEPAEPGRDLPVAIMRQICTHLEQLPSPEMRTGIELAIDTGRRPEEICELAFDCLARDDDGLAVLVYDNHKANRPARRLPIGETTATVIVAQQQRVRARWPDTPVGELKLLPTDRRNPHGSQAITGFSLAFAHRVWIDKIPTLTTVDGNDFDRSKVVLYAYRHTYAQRHADAGVGIDVLRELMSHRKLDTTKRYYRIGHDRRREAVDRVAAMQFDRHGDRVWRTVQHLLDSEHTRRQISQVAVPFGTCAEPSNVKAGGNACPYRFRCTGCDHFRTDISYLPDLQAYLDDLLRNRERLLAAHDIDDWARTEAMPSQEEIASIRRLISRISAGLDELTDDDRDHVEQAVAVVRRHRTATAGMPRIRQSLPIFRPEATA